MSFQDYFIHKLVVGFFDSFICDAQPKKKGSVHLGNCSNTIFGRNSGQGPPMFFYTRDVSLARARAAFKDSFRLEQLFGSLSNSLSSISFLARFFFVYLLNDTSIIQRKTR